MLLQNEHGARAHSPEEAEELERSGYDKCYKPDCNFYLSPEAQTEVRDHPDAGYYTCPKCKTTWDIMSELPWHGAPDVEKEHNRRQFEQERYEPWGRELGNFIPGGTTRIGLPLAEQAQIGEDLIEKHGLPGYGPILWWHPGGATAKSPLDGTTKDWGIEVKTLSFDAEHHRFIPGSMVEKSAKNAAAAELKLKGVLGVLVLLNFRTSMASVYVKEMPLETWHNSIGRPINGVAAFRSNAGQKLLEELPFKNPFSNPHSNVPYPAQQRPEADLPS